MFNIGTESVGLTIAMPVAPGVPCPELRTSEPTMSRTITKVATLFLVTSASAAMTPAANAIDVAPLVDAPVVAEAACLPVCPIVAISPHIILVPPLVGEARAAAEARDRQWVERCRPQIRQDRFGMPRYVYVAPGCEFGRLR